MSAGLYYSIIGAGLVGIGLYSLLLVPEILRKIITLNIIGNGVFLILVSISKPESGVIFSLPDPVPQAMVLTGVVVAVSATALALALLLRYYEATGFLVLPENTSDWRHEAEVPPMLPTFSEEDDGH